MILVNLMMQSVDFAVGYLCLVMPEDNWRLLS